MYAMGARVAATGLALLTSIAVARFYGADALGILAIVNTFLSLVAIFTVLGTNTSILRLIPEHIAKYSTTSAFRVYRKTQYLVAGASLMAGTIFFFASGIVADKVFNKPHLFFLLALSAGFFVFKSLMDLNTYAVRGLFLIRTFAFIQVLPSISMLTILLSITFLFKHPNNHVYAQLATFGVTAIIGALIMDRAFRKRRNNNDIIQPMPVRKIFSISTPMFMTASMNFFIG